MYKIKVRSGKRPKKISRKNIIVMMDSQDGLCYHCGKNLAQIAVEDDKAPHVKVVRYEGFPEESLLALVCTKCSHKFNKPIKI